MKEWERGVEVIVVCEGVGERGGEVGVVVVAGVIGVEVVGIVCVEGMRAVEGEEELEYESQASFLSSSVKIDEEQGETVARVDT